MYSQVVYAQILSGGSMYRKSCVDSIVEILLCEGGDVELCARTSKHILVCLRLIHFLQLSLSLILYIASYCSYHLYDWFDCVPILVFNQESFTWHLNSYLEEFRGHSPEPFTGNSATLFGCTKCVLISF